MLGVSNQIYRITYEAFSKFSNNLNSCRSFADIEECFSVNLKYLFNFHIYRASYNHNGRHINLVCGNGRTTITESQQAEYYRHEVMLLNSCRPMQWQNFDDLDLPDQYAMPLEDGARLWGWNFQTASRQIIVSVLTSNTRAFAQKDINFLRLASDNLETKLLELCLIKELDEKNAIISKVNQQQKAVIKKRTQELADKNKILLEISVLNAHAVREPLSRILGLIELINPDLPPDMMNEILPRLKISAEHLDISLKDVIQRTTKDLIHLKAKEL